MTRFKGKCVCEVNIIYFLNNYSLNIIFFYLNYNKLLIHILVYEKIKKKENDKPNKTGKIFK